MCTAGEDNEAQVSSFDWEVINKGEESDTPEDSGIGKASG
jgi:hypothetical protein